jgi:Domain of unknown function (DUF4314)
MTIPIGARIELVFMNDPYDPIPSGSRGTVEFANEYQVGVRWDNGRSLMLALPEDKFRIISEEEK